MPDPQVPARWRTLFLSDLHLGTLGCRADLLLDFLRDNPSGTYVLAGDVLDLWHPLLPHWTAQHQAVIDHLRARMVSGARVVWLTGNHDPAPDTAPQASRLPVPALRDWLHVAADGRRYLVLHGDVVDSRFIRAHSLTRLGSRIDHGLRRIDRALRRLRRDTGLEVRSTIEAALSGLNAWTYARRVHERRLVAMARAQGVDGVICGHFHIAALHDDHGLTYANCGDWVDSFSALAESADGSLRLLAAVAARVPALQPTGVPA